MNRVEAKAWFNLPIREDWRRVRVDLSAMLILSAE